MEGQLSRLWIALTLGVLMAVSTGCASSDPASDAPHAAASSGSVGTTHARADILDFAAPKLGGGTIQGSDYAGQDLAIWFWAPW